MSKTIKLSRKLLEIKRDWMEAFAPNGDWRWLITSYLLEDDSRNDDDHDGDDHDDDYDDDYYEDYEIDFGGDPEMIYQFFSKLPSELLADRELVYAVTSWDGLCLKCASEELRGDRELVLNAINAKSMNGEVALKYASKELQNDPELVLASRKHNTNN